MTHSFLLSLNEAEFKAFLREALTEILREVKHKAEANIPDILNVSEAAAFLKLQISTLYEKTATRLIPHFKKGNRLYFYRKDLEDWLREGRVKTQRELQSDASTFTMSKQYR
ncbi:MAG: helix-turn-helix domain-containing protein [Chryseolinea sp.]